MTVSESKLAAAALAEILGQPDPRFLLETDYLSIKVHEDLFADPTVVIDEETGEYVEFAALSFLWHQEGGHQGRSLAERWCASLGLSLENFNYEVRAGVVYLPLSEVRPAVEAAERGRSGTWGFLLPGHTTLQPPRGPRGLRTPVRR